MGAYVSIEECEAKGHVLNCTIDFSTPDNTSARALGDVLPGHFSPDPDIAGIGVRIGSSFPATLWLLPLLHADKEAGSTGPHCLPHRDRYLALPVPVEHHLVVLQKHLPMEESPDPRVP